MYYLIMGNPKIFTFESLDKLQAALNARVKVGEEMGIKLIKGTELGIEVIQEVETVTMPVNKLKIKGDDNV